MTRRLHFGLTDQERRVMDSNRRVRNCFIVMALLVVAMSVCSAL